MGLNTALRSSALMALIGVLWGCSPSTKIVQSWRDPAVTVEQGHYKKLLCMVMVLDESNRRVAEDKLVSLIHGHAVQSYSYLGDLPANIDGEKLAETMKADGYDAILIMRLAKREKEVSYVPGTYPSSYYSPWGYYGYARPYYGDPGYVRTDDYYFVETNLYDLGMNKLVWSGMTSSWEPSNIPQVVEDIAVAVRNDMVKKGFLITPEPAK